MLKKLILIFTILPTLIMAQHTIKGSFSPAEEFNYALLYKVTPNSNIYVNNAEIKDGKFSFELDSTVTKGMYRLVYALPQEEYNFDIIYNAKEDIVLNFNQEVGVNYTKSVENMLINSYTSDMAAISQNIGEFFKTNSKDTLALIDVFKVQSKAQNDYEKVAEGTIAESFIKANRPYIPEGFEDIKSYVKNLKQHYFNNVDFNDKTLQSSNFLSERIINYVFGMTDESLDDMAIYRENIDNVFNAMLDADLSIKKMLFTDLWQQLVDINLEEIAIYVSDKYLLDLAEKTEDTELVLELNKFKIISIGTIAPDFSLETSLNDVTTKTKLSELTVANEYVIVFWSSSCSHCLEEIPQLHAFIKTQEKENVQVIAIGLEDEPYNWQNLIVQYPNFMHVLGIGKWTNKLGKLYNVNATPTYFLLDKDKKIIAKPDDIVALKQYFEDQK